ncbi:MAG: HPr family phosphocarrier protein [Lachnospiraceae bacterium]|jgi:phosphotransferase system HPr-like phosphotransfer protein|nr:HPr family phosphocarrier protein [Lachnospiraceae bacterium]
MSSVKVNLNSIDKVKSFVNTISQFDQSFDLISGRYVINAKSIMGIFSLDLSQPIELRIQNEEAGDMNEVMEALKPYLV